MTEYQAGLCNINHKESRKRYLSAIISFAGTGPVAAAYFATSIPYLLILLLITTTFGFQGILQGRKNFCVAHAKKETEKTGDRTQQVENEDEIEEDNRMANRIIIQSTVSGLISTTLIYLATVYTV